MRGLKNNPDIIIQQDDMGGATIVMDKTAHIQETERQLSSMEFLTNDPKNNTRGNHTDS